MRERLINGSQPAAPPATNSPALHNFVGSGRHKCGGYQRKTKLELPTEWPEEFTEVLGGMESKHSLWPTHSYRK